MSIIASDITINVEQGKFLVDTASFSVPLVITREEIVLANGEDYQVISDVSQITSDGVAKNMVIDILGTAPRVNKVGVLKITDDSTVAAQLTARNNGDWYLLLYANIDDTTPEVLDDIKAISDWGGTNKKMFFVALKGDESIAPVIIKNDADTNYIGNASRTLALVQQNISEHIEAAWVSRVHSQAEGSTPYAPSRYGNNFSGKTTDSFSVSKSVDVREHNGSMYVKDSSNNYIDQSRMLDGQATAKQILQRDWMSARGLATIRSFLLGGVSYTDVGHRWIKEWIKNRVDGCSGCAWHSG